MKKMIATIAVMLLVAGSAIAVKRDTTHYHPTAKDPGTGKIGFPASIEIIHPGEAATYERLEGKDVVGYLDDEACGAQGLAEACAVVHDPHGKYFVKETTTGERKNGDFVGDIRGSKIKHVGDRYSKVLRVYKSGEDKPMKSLTTPMKRIRPASESMKPLKPATEPMRALEPATTKPIDVKPATTEGTSFTDPKTGEPMKVQSYKIRR